MYLTRGYLNLTKSSNLLQEPIDQKKNKIRTKTPQIEGNGKNWQEELRMFLAPSYTSREDTRREMLNECKLLGEVKLCKVKAR